MIDVYAASLAIAGIQLGTFLYGSWTVAHTMRPLGQFDENESMPLGIAFGALLAMSP